MIYWKVKKSALKQEMDILEKINRLSFSTREYNDNIIKNLQEIDLLKLEFGLLGEYYD